MVSVIIPTLNEAHIIDASLGDLLNRGEDFEVIVVDGGSSDGTLDIIRQFPEVRLIVSEEGRGKQMNEAAKAAKGDIFMFLHADTRLPKNGFRILKEAMSDSTTVGGCFYIRFDRQDLLLRTYSLFSRINHIFFTYGDQGLFTCSSAFRAIGGFKDIPIMEDVEIQQRLRRRGRFVKIGEPILTSARRFMRNGIIRQQILNTILVSLYHMGIPPSNLKPFYKYPLRHRSTRKTPH